MEERIKACISALAVFAASMAALFGYSLDAGTLAQVLCVAVYLASVAWGVWKNHNFTDAAIQAQGYLDELKEEARRD